MDDEAVAQFTAFTSADPTKAIQFLQLTEGNLEQAIQLYFENPDLDVGGALSPQASRPPPANTNHPTHYEDAGGVIHIDSDNEAEDPFAIDASPPLPPRQHTQPSVEDDEAIARRLQEEMYGGSGPEEVRAPIARTTETLIGPGANYDDEGDMHAAIFAHQRAQASRRRQAGTRPGIFNQQAGGGSVWQTEEDPAAHARSLAEATGGASNASSKATHLAELFRPPFDLMSNLPWDAARDQGKDDEKWLMVNIQDPAVFDCHILNRDHFKNKELKDIIRENFIFMQYNKDDAGASQYIQFYFRAHDSQAAFPHIAIIDPRTGEQMKVWSGSPFPDMASFSQQLMDFLGRYSLQVDARNPVATRKAEHPKIFDVDRMTEEEMLEMALQNSLAGNGEAGPRDSDPDLLTKPDTHDKGKQKAVGDAVNLVNLGPSATNGTPALPSAFARISSMNPHVEPEQGPDTTRIQFRYSGGRVIRKFLLSDPVRRIYEWLKASPFEGREGFEFELKAMGQDLIEVLDKSIAEAGLKQGTVMVEFLED